jgi:hypothetical protein
MGIREQLDIINEYKIAADIEKSVNDYKNDRFLKKSREQWNKESKKDPSDMGGVSNEIKKNLRKEKKIKDAAKEKKIKDAAWNEFNREVDLNKKAEKAVGRHYWIGKNINKSDMGNVSKEIIRNNEIEKDKKEIDNNRKKQSEYYRKQRTDSSYDKSDMDNVSDNIVKQDEANKQPPSFLDKHGKTIGYGAAGAAALGLGAYALNKYLKKRKKKQKSKS